MNLVIAVQLFDLIQLLFSSWLFKVKWIFAIVCGSEVKKWQTFKLCIWELIEFIIKVLEMI